VNNLHSQEAGQMLASDETQLGWRGYKALVTPNRLRLARAAYT